MHIKDAIGKATFGKASIGGAFWIMVHDSEADYPQFYGKIDGFKLEGNFLTLISSVISADELDQAWSLSCDIGVAEDKVVWRIYSYVVRPDGQAIDLNSGKFIPVEIVFY
jgi:hypothetical protein